MTITPRDLKIISNYIDRKISNIRKIQSKAASSNITIPTSDQAKRDAAYKSNTPKELLVKLAEDGSRWTRGAVAQNPNTPTEVLVKLAKDGEESVRRVVAQNPNTPAEVLVELAKSEEDWMKNEVAKHPNTPAEVLVELAKDRDFWVRENAQRNPNYPTPSRVSVKREDLDFEDGEKDELDLMKDFLETKGFEVADGDGGYQFEWGDGGFAGGFVEFFDGDSVVFECWSDGDRGDTPNKEFTTLKDLKSFFSKNATLLNKMKKLPEAWEKMMDMEDEDKAQRIEEKLTDLTFELRALGRRGL